MTIILNVLFYIYGIYIHQFISGSSIAVVVRRVHQVVSRVRVVIEVRVQGGLPVPSGAVHLVVVVHVGRHRVYVPVVVVVELLLLVHEGVVVVSHLLVPVQTILQIPLPDPEYYVQARLKMVIAEYLRLFQHLEIATQS